MGFILQSRDGWTTAFNRPSIRGSFIEVNVRDESVVGAAMDNVDQRIVKANADYESQVVPRLEAAVEKRNLEEQERQRKLEAAQRAVKEHEEGR